MRAAGYIRVSTTEQKLHGYSLDAQRELLQKYADEHGMKLVGIYADEGKSASKRLQRRTEILRLLDDAEKGMFDTILFKDLTRWSRNPSQFYAVQDRLDGCGVSWIAVEQPNLETVTASGRLIVGIHISVAAHESAQTSERIKFVNQSRVQKKYPLCGDRWLPLGYKVGMIDGQKRVVKDEQTQDAVDAIFDTYESTQCINQTLKAASEMGVHTWDKSLRKMFRNPIYKGEYHDVQEYCEPYLTPERWERIRSISEQHHYTAPKRKDGYTFSSLVKCASCGGTMTGMSYASNGKQYAYYQCKRYTVGTCTHKQMIREDVIEQYLIESVDDVLSKFTAEVKSKAKKKKNPATIRAKLNRLKELYIDGDISKEDYTKRKEEYEKELQETPPAAEALKNAFPDGWRKFYDSAPKTAKNAAWRSVVSKILVDEQNNISVEFLTF